MRSLKLLSTQAKRSSIAVALLVAVGQVLFVGSLFGGFHGSAFV
jgi:uncharacterized membrane protein YgdD (TMEM256/DUF423 family)